MGLHSPAHHTQSMSPPYHGQSQTPFHLKIIIHFPLSQEAHALHMPTMTKLIHDRHLLCLIPFLLKYLHIPRQCCRVTAHVDDTLRCHMDQSIQKNLIAALSRWVNNHDVRVGAVAALLIYIWNDFLCLANEELGICDPVDLGVVSCVIYSLWNDLHSVYLLCLLCEEQ